MNNWQTHRPGWSRSLLLAVLLCLLAVVVALGCHMHLPPHAGADQPGAESHCALCDLLCTFVAALLCCLLTLLFTVRSASCADGVLLLGRERSGTFFIRPPPAF